MQSLNAVIRSGGGHFHNEALHNLEMVKRKHEQTQCCLHNLQGEYAELWEELAKCQRLAESSFVQRWNEAKVYYFGTEDPLKK